MSEHYTIRSEDKELAEKLIMEIRDLSKAKRVDSRGIQNKLLKLGDIFLNAKLVCNSNEG